MMSYLWKLGHSPEDIISIVFRVCKNHDMSEYLKLEFIKVGGLLVQKSLFMFTIFYTRGVLLILKILKIRVLMFLNMKILNCSITSKVLTNMLYYQS